MKILVISDLKKSLFPIKRNLCYIYIKLRFQGSFPSIEDAEFISKFLSNMTEVSGKDYLIETLFCAKINPNLNSKALRMQTKESIKMIIEDSIKNNNYDFSSVAYNELGLKNKNIINTKCPKINMQEILKGDSFIKLLNRSFKLIEII